MCSVPIDFGGCLIIHLLLAAKVPSVPNSFKSLFYLSSGFASAFKTVACWSISEFFSFFALFSFPLFFFFYFSYFSVVLTLVSAQVSQDYLYIVNPACLVIRILVKVCTSLNCSCSLHMPAVPLMLEDLQLVWYN